MHIQKKIEEFFLFKWTFLLLVSQLDAELFPSTLSFFMGCKNFMLLFLVLLLTNRTLSADFLSVYLPLPFSNNQLRIFVNIYFSHCFFYVLTHSLFHSISSCLSLCLLISFYRCYGQLKFIQFQFNGGNVAWAKGAFDSTLN